MKIANTNLKVTKFSDFELLHAKSLATMREEQDIKDIQASKMKNFNVPYMEPVKTCDISISRAKVTPRERIILKGRC